MNKQVKRVAKFDYEMMVQNALRRVVQESLLLVQKDGLPGTHHFYITFETNRKDVRIPDFLREKHPEEVTIVLQHQFWDLNVTDVGFSVSLSFNDRHEEVYVPYAAIISFLDPAVKFGLQFVPEEDPAQRTNGKGTSKKSSAGDDETVEAPAAPITDGSNVITLDRFRRKD